MFMLGYPLLAPEKLPTIEQSLIFLKLKYVSSFKINCAEKNTILKTTKQAKRRLSCSKTIISSYSQHDKSTKVYLKLWPLIFERQILLVACIIIVLRQGGGFHGWIVNCVIKELLELLMEGAVTS